MRGNSWAAPTRVGVPQLQQQPQCSPLTAPTHTAEPTSAPPPSAFFFFLSAFLRCHMSNQWDGA